MYNRPTSENTTTTSTSTTSARYVADILSSMANGEPVAPTYSLPAYANSVGTGTTPTLTPTTLASIEQTFIELQSVPVSTAGHDQLNQSGFVPPIIDPISGSDQTPGGTPDHYDYSDSDQEWMASAPKSSRGENGKAMMNGSSYSTPRGRKSARQRDDDYEFNANVSPEEAERRRVRRERNKVAAAKCRQRRVDHTNKLINETDKLEDDKASLESEIQSLQQQKDQLEFILQAHSPVCKADGLINKLRVKSEYRSQCNGDTNRSSGLPSLQTIKREMPDYVDDYTSQCSMKTDHHALHASSRPSSLPLQAKTSMSRSSLSSATGISITTPTSGFFTGYSSLDMENHSGLTPLGGPSCASQIQKTSDSSPDGVTSPTLISL